MPLARPGMTVTDPARYRLAPAWRQRGVWLAGSCILLLGLITLGRGILPIAGPLTSPYDFGVFMYARYEGTVPVVSDVQSYLDLFSRGGRDLKQAQYLLENRIQTNWKAA